MSADSQPVICPNCHVGKLQRRQVTLTSTFEGQPLVVPNTSAWICDICNEMVVDQETLNRLSGLLATDRPRHRVAATRTPHP